MNRTKTKMLNIRTTPELHRQIQQRAARHGMSVSAFLTAMGVHGQVVVMEHIAEAAKQLNRIGVNLNQIARLANEGRVSTVNLTETQEGIRQIWQYLNSQTPTAG